MTASHVTFAASVSTAHQSHASRLAAAEFACAMAKSAADRIYLANTPDGRASAYAAYKASYAAAEATRDAVKVSSEQTRQQDIDAAKTILRASGAAEAYWNT